MFIPICTHTLYICLETEVLPTGVAKIWDLEMSAERLRNTRDVPSRWLAGMVNHFPIFTAADNHGMWSVQRDENHYNYDQPWYVVCL